MRSHGKGQGPAGKPFVWSSQLPARLVRAAGPAASENWLARSQEHSGFPDSKALRRDREERREKSIEMVKGMRIWKKRGEGFLGFTNWMS